MTVYFVEKHEFSDIDENIHIVLILICSAKPRICSRRSFEQAPSICLTDTIKKNKMQIVDTLISLTVFRRDNQSICSSLFHQYKHGRVCPLSVSDSWLSMCNSSVCRFPKNRNENLYNQFASTSNGMLLASRLNYNGVTKQFSGTRNASIKQQGFQDLQHGDAPHAPPLTCELTTRRQFRQWKSRSAANSPPTPRSANKRNTQKNLGQSMRTFCQTSIQRFVMGLYAIARQHL